MLRERISFLEEENDNLMIEKEIALTKMEQVIFKGAMSGDFFPLKMRNSHFIGTMILSRDKHRISVIWTILYRLLDSESFYGQVYKMTGISLRIGGYSICSGIDI